MRDIQQKSLLEFGLKLFGLYLFNGGSFDEEMHEAVAKIFKLNLIRNQGEVLLFVHLNLFRFANDILVFIERLDLVCKQLLKICFFFIYI